MNAREQAMAPTLDLGYDPLSTINEQLFAELWIPAEYVQISNKILTVRPMIRGLHPKSPYVVEPGNISGNWDLTTIRTSSGLDWEPDVKSTVKSTVKSNVTCL